MNERGLRQESVNIIQKTVTLNHYVELRLALRRSVLACLCRTTLYISPPIYRLQLKVQKKLEEEEKSRGQKPVEIWSEFVTDLWEKHLPNLREELNGECFVYNPNTKPGSYGFPEREGEDKTDKLEAAFLNESMKEREEPANSRPQPAACTDVGTLQDDLNQHASSEKEEDHNMEETEEGGEGVKTVPNDPKELDRCKYWLI